MSITVPNVSGPAWASWLGIVAVIFGILQTAEHGNEWMTQKVIAPGTAAVQGIAPRCPEDELVEEGHEATAKESSVAAQEPSDVQCKLLQNV